MSTWEVWSTGFSLPRPVSANDQAKACTPNRQEATALLLAERVAKVVLGARGSDRLKALADCIKAAVAM
jgi:hypothetical protein